MEIKSHYTRYSLGISEIVYIADNGVGYVSLDGLLAVCRLAESFPSLVGDELTAVREYVERELPEKYSLYEKYW